MRDASGSSCIYKISDPAQSSSHSLHDIQFTDPDVLAMLTTLDTSKACDIDNFNPKIFQYYALLLLQIICHLFSTSSSSSTIDGFTVCSLFTNQVTSPLRAIIVQCHYCAFSLYKVLE